MGRTKRYDFNIFNRDHEIIKGVLSKYEPGASYRNQFNRLKSIYDYFKCESILDESIDRFREYIEYLNTMNTTAHTKKRLVWAIMDILRYASLITHRDLRLNLIDKIEQIKFLSENLKNRGVRKEKIILSKEELYNFLQFYEAQQSERDYLIIAFLIFSGARVQPIAKLKIEDINYNDFYFQSKDKLTQVNYISTYFLPEPIFPLLKHYILYFRTDSETLFGISDKQIRVVVKNYYKLNGRLKEIHPHSFRHMFTTHFLLGGCPEFLVERFLNQVPTSVNRMHYNLLLSNIDFLKCAFHYYFPYKDFFPNYDWAKWDNLFKEFRL